LRLCADGRLGREGAVRVGIGTVLGGVVGGVVLFLLLFALLGLRIVYQYQRGVIFVFGRLIGAKGPGIFWVPPLISRMRKIDLRVVTVELPPQEGVTRDNVTLKVGAVLFFYVVNPSDVATNVLDYYQATVQIAPTTLRSVLGQSLLDEVLSSREAISQGVQKTIDERTEHWGLKVTAVEIKDVLLPPTMQRAMAKQAEAEREKRAKVLHAQGEFQAAQTLADAAHILSTEPAALQLRYLQTLTEIAVEKNSTIVFPLPIDLVAPLTALLRRASGHTSKTRLSAPIAPPVVPADSAPLLPSE
jgi:regulator of protease activity HflC (stomatin/prohibitin superfamily)